MLIKDKDILAQKAPEETEQPVAVQPVRRGIAKEHMSSAWGDAFDYYLRGITAKYLQFGGRATRLEFWGYAAVASLLYVPLYFIGDYADIPLLPYYFALATLIPTAAVATRRLHDINKRSAVYLIVTILLAGGCFFAPLYIFLPLLVWMFYLVHLFSKPTYADDGLYGEANEDDEVYGSDNLPIIHKFRLIAIMMSLIWLGATMIKFDDWSRQAEQKGTIEQILEEVAARAEEKSYSLQQTEAAKKEMMNILKMLQGKSLTEQQLKDYIAQALQKAGGNNEQNNRAEAPLPN